MFTPNQERAAASCCASAVRAGKIGLGELDARELHRPALQDHWQAPAAASRFEVPGPVGHARPSERFVRFGRRQHRDRPADLRLALQVAAPLARSLARRVWPAAESIRRPRPNGSRAAHHRPARPHRPLSNVATDGTMVVPADYLRGDRDQTHRLMAHPKTDKRRTATLPGALFADRKPEQ